MQLGEQRDRLRVSRDPRGRQDVVLAEGEHALTETMLRSWSRLRVLSCRNDEPERASRPFDADRDGLVLADAVVLLALESEEHSRVAAAGRWPSSWDTEAIAAREHLTAPTRRARWPQCAPRSTTPGWRPTRVDLVLAHGTATRRNDVVEGRALREVFGHNGIASRARRRQVDGGARDGRLGHRSRGSGIRFSTQGEVPPTINLDSPDPECAISGFSPVATSRPVGHAMVNAFAFGGHNAVLVFRRA